MCDRCLESFNYELKSSSNELIWISDETPDESHLKGTLNLEDLMDCIDPRSDFDPQRWVFEQLNLQLPLRKICDNKCPGPLLSEKSKARINSKNNPQIDPRWAELQNLL